MTGASTPMDGTTMRVGGAGGVSVGFGAGVSAVTVGVAVEPAVKPGNGEGAGV